MHINKLKVENEDLQKVVQSLNERLHAKEKVAEVGVQATDTDSDSKGVCQILVPILLLQLTELP